jgi:hypothetical protein
MNLTNYSKEYQRTLNFRMDAENTLNTLDGTDKDNFAFIDSACLMIQAYDKMIAGYYAKARKESENIQVQKEGITYDAIYKYDFIGKMVAKYKNKRWDGA